MPIARSASDEAIPGTTATPSGLPRYARSDREFSELPRSFYSLVMPNIYKGVGFLG